MTTLAAGTTLPASTVRTSVQRLALIEAKRYAKHPLFVLPALLCAGLSIRLPGPDELDYMVIPAFLLGLLGVVVAARLTRSTDASAAVLDAAPVPVTRRTAALCLACAVPALTGLAIVLLHRATMLADPIPEFRYGTYGVLDRQVITLLLPVVFCLGGPLLGVAIGRWLRFPGAPLLAVVGLLVWSTVLAYLPQGDTQAPSLTDRLLHVAAPYTAWAASDGDNVHPITVVTSFTGSPGWFLVWALALCAAAACTALRWGADARLRRQLSRAAVVIAVVAVASLTLGAVGGNSVNHDTTVTGRTTAVR